MKKCLFVSKKVALLGGEFCWLKMFILYNFIRFFLLLLRCELKKEDFRFSEDIEVMRA